MNEIVSKKKVIRAVVKQAVEASASGFFDRHLAEVNRDEGTIKMKIHNVFIAALSAKIKYY